MKKNPIMICVSMFFCALFTIIGSLYFGAVTVDFHSVSEVILSHLHLGQTNNLTADTVVWTIRAPRIISAFCVGTILATTGLVMQTITRNPLSEPYILGVSAGASAGAVSAIILGWFSFIGSGSVYVAAFVGAILAMTTVLLLLGKSNSPVYLVLLGMGVNAFFGAITTLLIYSSNNEAQVRSAMFWLVGSLSGLSWQDTALIGISMFIWIFLVALYRKDLDLLLLGRDTAQQLGLNVRQLQWLFICLSSLVIAITVAKTGVIGFIGLIVPHIAKRLINPTHGKMLILSSCLGGLLLSLADTVARSLFRPEELPIGILTAFIGAPIFVALIRQSYGGRR